MADSVTMRAIVNHERTINVPADKVEYREGLGWEVVPEEAGTTSRKTSRKSKKVESRATDTPSEE